MPNKATAHATLSKTNSADGFVKNQVARFESQQKLLLGPELHKLPFKIKPELQQRMTPFNAISQASSAGGNESSSSTGRTRRSVRAKNTAEGSSSDGGRFDNLESCLEYTSSCLPSCYWQSYSDSKLPSSPIPSANSVSIPEIPSASCNDFVPHTDMPCVSPMPTRSVRCSSLPISPISGQSLVLLTNRESAEAPTFGVYTPELHFSTSGDDESCTTSTALIQTAHESSTRQIRRLFQRTEQLKESLHNPTFELESVPSRPIPGVISRIVAEAKLTCDDYEDDEINDIEDAQDQSALSGDVSLYDENALSISAAAAGDDDSDEECGAANVDWHKCDPYPIILLPPPQISVVIVSDASRRDSGEAACSSVISSCDVSEHTPLGDEHTPRYAALLSSVLLCGSSVMQASPKSGGLKAQD